MAVFHPTISVTLFLWITRYRFISFYKTYIGLIVTVVLQLFGDNYFRIKYISYTLVSLSYGNSRTTVWGTLFQDYVLQVYTI